MDFFPIELAGRTYRLRFTPDDVRDICRRLTPLQPPGGAKVSPPLLGTLLVNLDSDAIELCMLYGLRHMAEYKKADLPDVQKLISNAIKAGAQYTEFRRPVFRALDRVRAGRLRAGAEGARRGRGRQTQVERGAGPGKRIDAVLDLDDEAFDAQLVGGRWRVLDVERWLSGGAAGGVRAAASASVDVHPLHGAGVRGGGGGGLCAV